MHEIERENVYSPVSLDGQNRTQIGWCMINQGAETLVKHVKDGKGCGFSSNIISRGLVSTNCSSCEHGRRRTQSRLLHSIFHSTSMCTCFNDNNMCLVIWTVFTFFFKKGLFLWKSKREFTCCRCHSCALNCFIFYDNRFKNITYELHQTVRKGFYLRRYWAACFRNVSSFYLLLWRIVYLYGICAEKNWIHEMFINIHITHVNSFMDQKPHWKFLLTKKINHVCFFHKIFSNKYLIAFITSMNARYSLKSSNLCKTSLFMFRFEEKTTI